MLRLRFAERGREERECIVGPRWDQRVRLKSLVVAMEEVETSVRGKPPATVSNDPCLIWGEVRRFRFSCG